MSVAPSPVREQQEALDLPKFPDAAVADVCQEAAAAPVDSVPSVRPSTLLHRIVIGFAVFGPLVACGIGLTLLWQVGMMTPLFLVLLLGGWVMTGMGITIGYHRLLTHGSFEAHPAVRGLLSIIGSLAIEGSPLYWCAVHRQHHQFSDKDRDPHTPHCSGHGWWGSIKGFVHAHFGWLFGGVSQHVDLDRYVPDLQQDPLLRWLHKYYGLVVLASFALPAIVGGLLTWSFQGALLGLLWGGLVRVCMTHHITWSINSICHIFGRQDYHSRDHSTNNTLFGILAHGEGWHNNHHAFPSSARHGLEWWQLDTSWLIIRGLERLGLVWNVQVPSAAQLDSKRIAS